MQLGEQANLKHCTGDIHTEKQPLLIYSIINRFLPYDAWVFKRITCRIELFLLVNFTMYNLGALKQVTSFSTSQLQNTHSITIAAKGEVAMTFWKPVLWPGLVAYIFSVLALRRRMI